MGKRGPKPIEIDWDKIDKLAYIQCTGEEIAEVVGISYDTLERAVKRKFKIKCADYIAQKALGGKASLRRRMWTTGVTEGNVTMQIWLSKNLLGYSDKTELSTGENKPFELAYKID